MMHPSKQSVHTWYRLSCVGLASVSPADVVPFESENGGKEMDEAFLKLLKESTTGTTKGEKGKSLLQKLDLEEHNVAKVGHVKPPNWSLLARLLR